MITIKKHMEYSKEALLKAINKLELSLSVSEEKLLDTFREEQHRVLVKKGQHFTTS